jgi:hypothetical protein
VKVTYTNHFYVKLLKSVTVTFIAIFGLLCLFYFELVELSDPAQTKSIPLMMLYATLLYGAVVGIVLTVRSISSRSDS